MSVCLTFYVSPMDECVCVCVWVSVCEVIFGPGIFFHVSPRADDHTSRRCGVCTIERFDAGFSESCGVLTTKGAEASITHTIFAYL